MSQHLTLTYPLSAAPQQVFDLMRDRDFVLARLSVLEVSSAELVEYEITETSLKTSVVTKMPRAALPRAVRGFVRGEPGFRRSEVWTAHQGGFKGSMQVKLDGTPSDVRGEMHLEPQGDGCLLTFECSVAVPIPVFGKLVESTLVEQITQASNVETSFLQDRIAQLNGAKP